MMQTHGEYLDTFLEEPEETPPISTNGWTPTNESSQTCQTGRSAIFPTSSFLNVGAQNSELNPLREMGDEFEDGLSSISPTTSPDLHNFYGAELMTNQNVISTTTMYGSTSNFIPLSNLTFNGPLSPGSDNVIQNAITLSSSIYDLQDVHIVQNIDSSPSNNNSPKKCSERISTRSPPPENDLQVPSVIPYRLDVPTMPLLPRPCALARQVANRVIHHARVNKIPDNHCMRCPDCCRLPVLPVTGQCGHTRCYKCIKSHDPCPCGVEAPKNLHVNTLVQDLINKMLPNQRSKSGIMLTSGRRRIPGRTLKSTSRLISGRRQNPPPHGVIHRQASVTQAYNLSCAPHIVLTPQARFDLARWLLASGRYYEATPHLARVVSTEEPLARVARTLLAQAIAIVSNGQDPRRLTRSLFRSVRAQAASNWLKSSDLECVLCYHTYKNPVTTPCGHNYCRTCIERSMDYRKACALCLRSLEDFYLNATNETVFLSAALAAIDAVDPPSPPEPDVIPIFVCTVAYPSIPCPLFIFDPRYWLMIRRVLESGSRKFGMVAYERDRIYSDYGTVLQVCDCVHLEDGRSILSTVGVSRFRVIERDVRDGCDVARIQPWIDIIPTEDLVVWDLRIMATQVWYKAVLWLNRMDRSVRAEIQSAFGEIPQIDERGEEWWKSPDGPAWLWWLIAILPLRSEIKVLILSTKNLLKRVMAVSRTLEAIDQVSISSNSECALRSALTNAEEWLERSA